MSLFSTNRFKSLSAEYVEESEKRAAEEVEDIDTEAVDEAAYVDYLLESLNE